MDPIRYVRLFWEYVLAKAAVDLILAGLITAGFYGCSALLASAGAGTIRSIGVHGKTAALILGAFYVVATMLTASVRAVYCIRFDLRSRTNPQPDAERSPDQDDHAT